MMVIVEQLVEWRLAGETEVPGENLPQHHFVHQKSHMTGPGHVTCNTKHVSKCVYVCARDILGYVVLFFLAH
jgi:hypothetical protein